MDAKEKHKKLKEWLFKKYGKDNHQGFYSHIDVEDYAEYYHQQRAEMPSEDILQYFYHIGKRDATTSVHSKITFKDRLEEFKQSQLK